MRDEKRGTGVPPVDAAHGRASQATVRIRRGAYLPHWTQKGGIYFVTFRLADALPQSVVVAWRQEREDLLRQARQKGRPLSVTEERRLQQLFSERVDTYLDAGAGCCWMKQAAIADLVLNALRHFDGQRYLLVAWCVMPNHAHVVLKPAEGYELEKILHSWTSFTAHQAVRLLGIQGPFWQPEYYDHLIRDDEDLLHAVGYTVTNPEAAGLGGWRWVGMRNDLQQVIEGGTGVPPVSGVHGRDARATS